MEITGLYADGIYLALTLFAMYAHWQKKAIKNEGSGTLASHFTESFWTTTVPAIAAGVIGYFGLAALSPETFYPVSKIGLVSVFTWAFTSDSLLNGEIKPKE
jgi:hypothetical protein